MKNLFKILFVALLAMGIAACSKEVNEGPTVSSGDRVWMSFKISLPTTRSKTDENQGETNSDADEDWEVGLDKENKVSSVQLLLMKGANNAPSEVIAVSDNINQGVIGAGDIYTVPFQSGDLMEAAAESTTTDIWVVAYCNHTTTVAKGQGVEQILAEVSTETESIYADDNFWMTNANDVDWKRQLPSKNDLITKYKTKDQPYDIGTIKVERTAARFDIAADEKSTVFSMEMTNDEATVNQGIQVILDEVALFNVRKDFYKVRRVSDDGTATNWSIFGLEGVNNYVVDSDYDVAYLSGETLNSELLAAHFSKTTSDALVWKKISELDVDDKWTDNGHTDMDPKPDYKVWDYAVENTFAKPTGENENNQIQSLATGVAFKGHIAGDQLTQIGGDGQNAIYVYAKRWLLGDAAHFKALAEDENADLEIKAAYEYAKDAQGGIDDTKLDAALLTKYTPDKGQYLVHYNYYNRHNDNGDPKVSTNMEFAVVRNNVYKIKVNAIGAFGTPEWKEPEPEPIEKNETFFKVEVQVLPWVVRVNDIVLE